MEKNQIILNWKTEVAIIPDFEIMKDNSQQKLVDELQKRFGPNPKPLPPLQQYMNDCSKQELEEIFKHTSLMDEALKEQERQKRKPLLKAVGKRAARVARLKEKLKSAEGELAEIERTEKVKPGWADDVFSFDSGGPSPIILAIGIFFLLAGLICIPLDGVKSCATPILIGLSLLSPVIYYNIIKPKI